MRYLNTSLALCFAAFLPGYPALAQQDTISTAIGGGPSHVPATTANLDDPIAVAVDAAGNYYISTYNGSRVFKVNTSGILTVLAGTGYAGYSGDGVPGGAADAMVNGPTGIAVDSGGNVYFADWNSCVIRKVDSSHTITTIAGIAGQCGFSGDGSPATSFKLNKPYGIGLDHSGNLYIADSNNCRVRQLALASNTISTYAGTGACSYTGDGGAAASATVNVPGGVAADTAGNVYIADTNNYRIREVTQADGKINTIAGIGSNGFTGDGGPATAAKIGQVLAAITVDGAGTTVTFAEYNNERVRQFTVGGNINTIAGKGSGGFCGDGSPAIQACFFNPDGVAVSGSTVFVADRSNNRIRQFTLAGGIGGNISTVAGNGSTTLPTTIDGVPPEGVVFNYPWAVIQDPSGNAFVSDQNNCIVRKLVEAAGVVNVLAGTGTCSYSGDGGPATLATLNKTYGLARDSSGNVYIADTLNHIIRKVDTSGTITTFAGTPLSAGFTGDGGLATSAKLRNPYGLAVDNQNNVYIADTSNHVIRKVSGGIITTIAGIGGLAGFLGDGNPATTAKLNNPYAVALDGARNVYIADSSNNRIRKIDAVTGIISTVAGDGSTSFDGDGPATLHAVYSPRGVTADVNGNLFIADTYNHRLRWVDTAGNMTTFGGTGTAAYNGDGGPAFSAALYYPTGIAEDAAGNFLVADEYNWRIRGITAFSGLTTTTSSLAFGTITIGSASTAQNLTVSAVGPLSISNILVTGDYTEYDNCGSGLANGQTCRIYVTFKPKAAGTRTGTLTVQHNGFFGQSTIVNLSGTGSAISIAGNPVNFDNQLAKTTSAPKTVQITNKSNAGITMRGITINQKTDFAISSNTCPASGQVLAAAASCTIKLVFKPQTTGLKKGALIINDSDSSSPQIAGMSGTGISNVSLTPASVSFPAQAVGTTTPSSSAKKITLTNNTGAAVTLGNPAISITGPFGKLGASSCTNNLVIPPGGTCTIILVFSPTAVGYPTGTVSVTDSDATSPQSAALSGIATGVLFAPSSLDFGTSTVGHQVQSAVTITNVGPAYIYFTGWIITGTNARDFTSNASDPPCSGALAPGAACTFTMYFTPSVLGAESASFLVYDNSPGTPQVLPLTGTGQ